MGKELLTNVISNTGLPEDAVRREFSTLLEKNGLTESTLTLESLRVILADYLQDVFCEAQEKLSKQKSS